MSQPRLSMVSTTGRPVQELSIAEWSENMQNAIMASVTIRDVPDDTRRELAARAAVSGQSLQQYLRSALIALADRPDNAAILARIRERAQRTGEGLSAEQILELRAADQHERETP